MRKQYYFRPSPRGLLAWDVDRLVVLSRELPKKRVELSTLKELDEPWHGDEKTTTWRAMVDHMRLVQEADLSFPIILSSNGAVMDGRHRLAKSLLEGKRDIEAVQFQVDPEPDHVGKNPDDLPYEAN